MTNKKPSRLNNTGNFLVSPFRKFYGYIKKDFLLLYKRKKYLYLFILLPLIIASLFLFALNPTEYKIDVGVCDNDDSEYSSQSLSDLRNFNPVLLNEPDNCEQKLLQKIKSGEFDLGLLVPQGFSDNIQNLNQARLIIFYDNTDIAFANLVSWKVDQSIEPFKRDIIDNLNQELKSRVKNIQKGTELIIDYPLPQLFNSEVKDINKNLKNLEEMDTEFLVRPIWTQKIPLYDDTFKKSSAIAFVFPILSLFILLMLASTSIIYDKKTGHITRVKSSSSPLIYLFSKTIFFIFLAIVQFLIIFLLFLAYGSSYSFSILEALKLIIYIGVINSLLGFIIGFISNNEGIAVLFSLILAFPLMLVSGIFFPIQTLPKVLQWIAQILPLKYQIDATKSVLLFNQTLSLNWFYVCIGMFVIVLWLNKKS
ncbi:MAG: ABC transporter permease [Nanoarchaeota archaeon]